MRSSSWRALVLLFPSPPSFPRWCTSIQRNALHLWLPPCPGKSSCSHCFVPALLFKACSRAVQQSNVIQKAGNMSVGPLADCTSWRPPALILACNDAVAVNTTTSACVIGHDRASAEAAIGVLCQQMPTLSLWALQGACQQREQDQYHHGEQPASAGHLTMDIA